MTEEQRLQNLCVPTGPIDVVLDTDTFNEIDDQFAIAYLLRAGADIRTAANYAAYLEYCRIYGRTPDTLITMCGAGLKSDH